MQEARYHVILALIVIPHCIQLAVDVQILSSSITAQLVHWQQPRLHLDELPFIEKELKQLVQRHVTTMSRVFWRWCQPSTLLFVCTLWWQMQMFVGVHVMCIKRATDVAEEGLQAVVCRCGDECSTCQQVDFIFSKFTSQRVTFAIAELACRQVDLSPK